MAAAHRVRAKQLAQQQREEKERSHSEKLYQGLSDFPRIDPSGFFSCVIQSDNTARPIPIGATAQKVIICTLIHNPNRWDDKKAAPVAGALQHPDGNYLKPPVVHEVRRYIEAQYQKHSQIPPARREAESIYWNTIYYNNPEWTQYADSFVPETKVFHGRKPSLNLIRVPNSAQYLQPSERHHYNRITHKEIDDTYEILYILPESFGKQPVSVGPYAQRLIICMILHLSWDLKGAFDPFMVFSKKSGAYWNPILVGEIARYIQIQSQDPRTDEESDHWNTILYDDPVWRNHVEEFDKGTKRFRNETPDMRMTHGPNTGRIVKDPHAIIAPRLPASAPPPAASNSGNVRTPYVNTDKQPRPSRRQRSQPQSKNPASSHDRQYPKLLPRASPPPSMRQSPDQQGYSTGSSPSTEDSLSRLSIAEQDIPRIGPGRTRTVRNDVEEEMFNAAVRNYPDSRLASEDVDEAVRNYPNSRLASEDVDERGRSRPVVTSSRHTERSPSLYPYMSLEAAKDYRENYLNRGDEDRNPITNLPAGAIDTGISQSEAPGYIWYDRRPRTPISVGDEIRRSPVPAATHLGYPTEPRSRSQSRSRLSVPASAHSRGSHSRSREQTTSSWEQYVDFSPGHASREPSTAPRGANTESSLHTTAHLKHPRDSASPWSSSKASTPGSRQSRHDDGRTPEQGGDKDEQRKSSGQSRRSGHSRKEDDAARSRRHEEKRRKQDY